MILEALMGRVEHASRKQTSLFCRWSFTAAEGVTDAPIELDKTTDKSLLVAAYSACAKSEQMM